MAINTFDYEKVRNVISKLESELVNFSECIESVNKVIMESVNVDGNSAVYGIVGKKLINLWKENTGCFTTFSSNVNQWRSFLVNTSMNYSNFEMININ